MTMTEEVSPKEMLEYVKSELQEFANEVNKVVNRRIEIIDKYIKTLEGESAGFEPTKPEKKTFKGKELKGAITPGQLNFLKSLYKQLGREVPEDIETWSKATASAVIDELLKIKNQGKR